MMAYLIIQQQRYFQTCHLCCTGIPVNVGTHKKNSGEQKLRKLRLLSSTKGEETRIEL